MERGDVGRSNEEEDGGVDDEFSPSKIGVKRRKTHIDDDGSGSRASFDRQITAPVDGGDTGDNFAGHDGTAALDGGEGDIIAEGNPSAPRRGRPPGRRPTQAPDESLELAPYMLSERRSTRAVVAAIQEALEPRISAAARDCALYNAKIVAERVRTGPVYWDTNTQTLQAAYAISAPLVALEDQILPNGAEVSANSRNAVSGKRQNAEHLFRELITEISDAKSDPSFNKFGEWKDKFVSGWAAPEDAGGTYMAPIEPVQASLPRFTSTRAAAAAALASFQAPGGILSSLTPAPNKIAARTIQAISRLASGGRGKKKRGGDSDDEDEGDISDDDDEMEESLEDADIGGSESAGEEPAAPPPKPAPSPTRKSKGKAAAPVDSTVLCGECHEATLEEALSCSQCRSLHHPSCLQLAVRTVARVKTYPWRCNECKLCETCSATGDESKLLMCDACDRGYHTYCLNPPLEALPAGEWICDICKVDGITPSTEPQPIALPQPVIPKKRGRPPKSAGATPKTSTATRKRKRTAMEDYDDLDGDDDVGDGGGDDDGDYR